MRFSSIGSATSYRSRFRHVTDAAYKTPQLHEQEFRTQLATLRVGERIVSVPPLRILPGSDVWRVGDRGRLVLPRAVAHELGLV